MPIFIAIIWLMHPVLGWLALTGAVILFAIAVLLAIHGSGLLEYRPSAGELGQ